MKLRLLSIFLILLMTGMAYQAWASERTNSEKADKKFLIGIGFSPDDRPLHLEVGLSIGVVPAYEGGDDYIAIVSPLLTVTKPGAYFINGASINPNDGLLSAGLSLVHFGYRGSSGGGVKVNFGPYLRAHPGRNEEEDDALNGLGDIDASVGLGLFLDVEAGDWFIQLAAAPHGVDQSADDGLLVSLDVRYRTYTSDKWMIDSILAVSWGNDEYIQGYYGVTPTQSASSGYAVYYAEAGVKDVGIYVQSSYSYTSDWLWHTQIGYWELQGDVADSPIVETGSAGQVRALIGFTYKF